MKKERNSQGRDPRTREAKTDRDQDPRTREQRRAMPTASEVLQSNMWKYNTWRRTEHNASSQEANDKWDNKFDQDKSNVIINTDQNGCCLGSRQRISETRMKPISRRSKPCGLVYMKRMCPALLRIEQA